MSPVEKAIWFIESHWQNTLTLDDVARASHVSPYHLTRAFSALTGTSLMRYVRARRLTEAARMLADGATDILPLALASGYHSHEAFTRAFRDQFGCTPEHVRECGSTAGLALTEPIALENHTMPTTSSITPRIESVAGRTLAGFAERLDCQNPAGIPGLWQRFGSHLGHVPGQIGPVAYGACYDFDGENLFTYLACVEVNGRHPLPSDMTVIEIPNATYAIFHHAGHVAGIKSTMMAIWQTWFPSSGYLAAESPTLEVYGPQFNGRTGLGGFEIWIPVKSAVCE